MLAITFKCTKINGGRWSRCSRHISMFLCGASQKVHGFFFSFLILTRTDNVVIERQQVNMQTSWGNAGSERDRERQMHCDAIRAPVELLVAAHGITLRYMTLSEHNDSAVDALDLNRNIKRTNRRLTNIYIPSCLHFIYDEMNRRAYTTKCKRTSTNANAEHCWFFEKPASRIKRCCVCSGNDNKKKLSTNQPKPNGKKEHNKTKYTTQKWYERIKKKKKKMKK